MGTEITIESLFAQAAERLRADFEFIRRSNPHPGEKGQEVEGTVTEFLNRHLPRRWRVEAGYVLDVEDTLSRQSDVLIYDSLSAPLYRAGERMNIIPADNVACVIEVKSTLNKQELKDAYEKIASVKRLKRRDDSIAARHLAESIAPTQGTLGIVFAFEATTSLKTLAANMAEMNKDLPCDHWPDIVVVLDKGMIDYAPQWPGGEGFMGQLMTTGRPVGATFGAPPWFIHLCVHDNGTRSLNRVFLSILTQLTYFPLKSGVPPFNRMLGNDQKLAMTCAQYQYDLSYQLKTPPPEAYNSPIAKLRIEIRAKEDDSLHALVHYLSWQDGAVIRKAGPMPLEMILALVGYPKDSMCVKVGDAERTQFSMVLAITETQFRSWPEILDKKSNFKTKLVVTGESAPQSIEPKQESKPEDSAPTEGAR